MQNTIAIIWDFDKTLIPEYMEDPLFRYYNIDGKKFWNEVNHLPDLYKKQGVMHVSKDTVYLNHILTYIQKGFFHGLNNALLRKLGAKLELHNGLPQFLPEIKKYVADKPEFQKHNIVLEHYIVSTGIRELIVGSKIAPFVEGIWGNEFIESIPQPGYLENSRKIKNTKVLSQVGYIVDNTTKTRALFEINKGVNKLTNIDVNAFQRLEERRIPFTHMIYIADGPSDIPSYSIVKARGGKTFVVYKPGSKINFMQGLELLKQNRVDMLCEANYAARSQTSLAIYSAVDEICANIIGDELRSPKLGHIYHEEYVYNGE